jgi:hypothetical protein
MEPTDQKEPSSPGDKRQRIPEMVVVQDPTESSQPEELDEATIAAAVAAHKRRKTEDAIAQAVETLDRRWRTYRAFKKRDGDVVSEWIDNPPPNTDMNVWMRKRGSGDQSTHLITYNILEEWHHDLTHIAPIQYGRAVMSAEMRRAVAAELEWVNGLRERLSRVFNPHPSQ